MERLTFKIGDAFPSSDSIAVWVMNLSIALGDLRIVADYAVRDEQPDHERIYFIRIMTSHLREIAKLLDLDYDEREDVRDFVAKLPESGQKARTDAVALLHSTFRLRPDVVVWEDIKRLRDDTFHYARDTQAQVRLSAAMEVVASRQGHYTLTKDGRLRAEYADLVTANRMHPFEQEKFEDVELPITKELHDTIIDFNGHVASFIASAEATYLFDVMAPGVVRREEVEDGDADA
jgi:hypothetical protein